MNKAIVMAVLTVCTIIVPAQAQKDKKDKKGKPPAGKVQVALKPEEAGPDWQVQGEYLGAWKGGSPLGAEVVAKGDGNFLVNILPGGLRGEGGDYAKHTALVGLTKDGVVKMSSKDGKWSATIGKNVLAGTGPEGAFTLKKSERRSKTLGMQPPPGAIVLFDGKNVDEWNKGQIIDGNLAGNGTVSKRKFGDFTLHLEFRLSFMPYKGGQGRSNSGVYLQHRHEIQVLDSFGLKGAKNECGALYGRRAPDVNMCFPPLTWQTYDVDFTAARTDEGGKKTEATVTVRHNGVIIHEKVGLGGSSGKGVATGPLHLQSHGGQVQYRNIWVLERK